MGYGKIIEEYFMLASFSHLSVDKSFNYSACSCMSMLHMGCSFVSPQPRHIALGIIKEKKKSKGNEDDLMISHPRQPLPKSSLTVLNL